MDSLIYRSNLASFFQCKNNVLISIIIIVISIILKDYSPYSGSAYQISYNLSYFIGNPSLLNENYFSNAWISTPTLYKYLYLPFATLVSNYHAIFFASSIVHHLTRSVLYLFLVASIVGKKRLVFIFLIIVTFDYQFPMGGVGSYSYAHHTYLAISMGSFCVLFSLLSKKYLTMLFAIFCCLCSPLAAVQLAFFFFILSLVYFLKFRKFNKDFLSCLLVGFTASSIYILLTRVSSDLSQKELQFILDFIYKDMRNHHNPFPGGGRLTPLYLLISIFITVLLAKRKSRLSIFLVAGNTVFILSFFINILVYLMPSLGFISLSTHLVMPLRLYELVFPFLFVGNLWIIYVIFFGRSSDLIKPLFLTGVTLVLIQVLRDSPVIYSVIFIFPTFALFYFFMKRRISKYFIILQHIAYLFLFIWLNPMFFVEKGLYFKSCEEINTKNIDLRIASFLEMACWAKKNTSPDSVFLTPPDQDIFQYFPIESQRNILFNKHDIMLVYLKSSHVSKIIDTIEVLGTITDKDKRSVAKYNDFNDDFLDSIYDALEYDFIVVDADYAGSYTVVFSNKDWKILANR